MNPRYLRTKKGRAGNKTGERSTTRGFEMAVFIKKAIGQSRIYLGSGAVPGARKSEGVEMVERSAISDRIRLVPLAAHCGLKRIGYVQKGGSGGCWVEVSKLGSVLAPRVRSHMSDAL